MTCYSFHYLRLIAYFCFFELLDIYHVINLAERLIFLSSHYHKCLSIKRDERTQPLIKGGKKTKSKKPSQKNSGLTRTPNILACLLQCLESILSVTVFMKHQ